MHIDTIPNRKSKPTYLLRESVREGKHVRKRTLANLTGLPLEQIEMIRRVLKGERLGPLGGLVCRASRHHGHVAAVLTAIRRLGLEPALGPRDDRQRRLVVAMIAGRIIAPEASKLGMVQAWADTTLGQELGLGEVHEDELYEAMDWLLERQEKIEQRLARRHLRAGGLVLFDLTSSVFEGTTCPLAKIGYSRDGKRGTLQVNYGIMTDARGCPVSVSVFEGNTGDPRTLLPQVEKVRQTFGIERLVMVGDRGMISNVQITAMRAMPGVDWITALKSGAIAGLVAAGSLQPDLFDERNLFELTHEDYPGERLIACRNPTLAAERARKRAELIAATRAELDTVAAMVAAGSLAGADKIGLRVGKVIGKYKVGKHFDLDMKDASFKYIVNDSRVAAEAALDGIYVIRTSVAKDRLSDAQAVLDYKRLADVERAFRTLKGIDLQVRPIRHRLEHRVKAHIFLSMLAYYVQWHMREAWAELTFADADAEDMDAARAQNPVARAERSQAARDKAHTRRLADGTPALAFTRLLAHLATIVRNTLQPEGARPGEATFTVTTAPSPKQQRALDLLAALTV
jgi:hypothetical protein